MRAALALALALAAPAGATPTMLGAYTGGWRAPLVFRPPFPEAVGFGALAQVGGATGYTPTICEVVNANDTGVGSLRGCVGAGQSDAIVIVKTGGTVVQTSTLNVTGNRVLISAMRAPGEGFQIKRNESGSDDSGGLLNLYGDDLVVRNIRFRADRPTTCPAAQSVDGLDVFDSADRVLIDRTSASHGTDEVCNIGISLGTPGPNDVTWMRSICAEDIHIPACDGTSVTGSGIFINAGENTTLWRNVMGITNYRAPNSATGGIADYVNNVWAVDGLAAPSTFYDCNAANAPKKANFISNSWQNNDATTHKEIIKYHQRNCLDTPGDAPTQGCDGYEIYLSGNEGWTVNYTDANQSPMLKCYYQGVPATADYGCNGGGGSSLFVCSPDPDNTGQVYVEHPVPYTRAVLAMSPAKKTATIADAGALPRDDVDTCVVDKIATGVTEPPIDNATNGCGPAEVLDPGTWCEGALGNDTDAENICDAWETTHFGSLSATPLADADGDLYLNVEEFLNDTDPSP